MIKIKNSVIQALEQLLTIGEVEASELQALSTGEEITCGTLGELIIRVLNYLEISLLIPIPPTDAEYITSLNARLSNAIAILLQKQIWQFNPGGSGRNSSYSINPDFSDSCYRVLGAKYFNR